MKLCAYSTVSSGVSFLVMLVLFCIVYDGKQHAVDAKPKFLDFFRAPNYQPSENYYQQRPYEPIIEHPHHFGPQTDGGYAWNRRHQQQHQRQSNGKQRYNEICNVIHGIGACHG